MSIAYVALGGNLGHPAEQMQRALDALAQHPQVTSVSRSGFYRTAPVGYDNQPDFINAVARVETSLPAMNLLQLLFALEHEGGRERSFANAPRTLDLDLLLYDDLVSTDPVMTLPHPRMHERAFVLRPLAEIAPELSLPGHGPLDPLLEACQDQRIERIAG